MLHHRFWPVKRQEGVKSMHFSLKDHQASSFTSSVFLWDSGCSSQHICPSIKGFCLGTKTLSQRGILTQSQYFKIRWHLSQASRVAALLLARGFGSLSCCSSSPSTAGMGSQPTHWWAESLWAACGQTLLACLAANCMLTSWICRA